jgi:hypothetical protein
MIEALGVERGNELKVAKRGQDAGETEKSEHVRIT